MTALGTAKVKKLVLDERYFEGPATVASWPEAELSYWYEAETSAISFNDNCVALEMRPGRKPGRRPGILLAPDFGFIKIVNRAVTGAPGSPFTLDYRREPGANKVVFFGSMPFSTGPAHSDFVSVHDPTRFAAETLKRIWRQKGLKVGKVIPWEKAGLREELLDPVFSWQSEPLEDLVKIVNKNSHNFYAEQLLRTLGKESVGRGTFSDGLAAVDRFLAQAGLRGADYHLIDGSGLSEDNRFTAAGLVRLLRHMRATPLFPIYYESLAAPGRDHSMLRRMNGDPLAADMRLKRGTVAHARNLAGYFKSSGGRLYAFAVLVNGTGLDRQAVDAALDRLCLAAAHRLP